MLKLENKDSEIIEKYKEIICDKFKLEEHLNIIRSLKDEEFIQQKIFDLERDNYNITVMSSTYHKIKHIKSLEQRMKIQKYQINAKLDDITYFNIPDNEYILICKLFEKNRKKPLKHFSFDLIVPDEAQDITSLYYELICKIYKDNILNDVANVKICIFGDKKQSIFDFNKADSRYITFATQLFNFNNYEKHPVSSDSICHNLFIYYIL
jgi:superfamily I DNA/RNA helicase